MSEHRPNLRQRFEAFVQTLERFESIDSLLKKDDRPGMKRADYLFNNRQFVVEQKSLEIDPNDKPQKFVNRLMEENKVIVFGQVSTKMIFDKMPDGKKYQHELVLRLTRGIEKVISHADKQTRDTREIFSVLAATGIWPVDWVRKTENP